MNDITTTDLIALATDIRAHHEAAVRSATDAITHAREAGLLLLQAKAAVPRGEWLPWLDENFSMTARTAQQYMRLSKLSPANAKRVSHLPLRQALKEIATPKPADAPESKTLLRTKPLLSEPIDVIRDLGQRWYDIELGLCLLLFADGATADEITVLTGFDAHEVNRILNPRPPTRFTNSQDIDTLSRATSCPSSFIETYRSLVDSHIACIMARACENAELYHADREGMPHTKAALNSWTRLWRAREAGSTWEDLHDLCGDLTSWAYVLITDVRLAIGLDREYAGMGLTDLMDEAHAAGAHATESRRLQ